MEDKTLILKFGGASVAEPASFARIAEIIRWRLSEFPRLVVVVSAMGDMTDRLIALAREVNATPPRREYDMLVSVGERISISLLAMALAKLGVEAVSFTGSQSGIVTSADHSDARIVEVRPRRLVETLDRGQPAIVAGFQGVSVGGEITTLGRGGSDTTAVALGVALGAVGVEFYKDVRGVYDKDPKECSEASLCPSLSYADCLDVLADNPHKEVLNARCIRLAQKHGLPLRVKSYTEPKAPGTAIGGGVEASVPLPGAVYEVALT